jgi:hypothetical protein
MISLASNSMDPKRKGSCATYSMSRRDDKLKKKKKLYLVAVSTALIWVFLKVHMWYGYL